MYVHEKQPISFCLRQREGDTGCVVYTCLPPWQAREEAGLGQPTWPEPVLKVRGREQLHQPLRVAPCRCGPASQPNMPRLDPSVPSSVPEIAEGLSWLWPHTPSAAGSRALVGREPWLQRTDGRPSTRGSRWLRDLSEDAVAWLPRRRSPMRLRTAVRRECCCLRRRRGGWCCVTPRT